MLNPEYTKAYEELLDSGALLSQEFILAGRAIFTVGNASGEHYTYKITKKEAEGRAPLYFVALLTGPDNTSNYTYLGMLDIVSGGVRMTSKSRHTPTSQPVRVLQWALRHIYTRRPLPPGYIVQHAGRCGKCGRLLTEPESLRTGIGPICRAGN